MKRVLSILAMALLLAGCGSRATTYYLLQEDMDPFQIQDLPGTALVVTSVNIPDYLDRNGVVLREEGGSVLNVPVFNIWAEPIEEGVRRVVSARMARPMLERGIYVLPAQDAHQTPAYSVVIDILRMDAVTDGEVVLDACWSFLDTDTQRIITRGSFVGSEKVEMPKFGTREMFDVIVSAHSRLVQQMGDLIGERGRVVLSPRRQDR